MKGYLNKRKDVPCLWIGYLNIIKKSILPLILRFNAISVKIPEGLFCRNWQVNFKIYI